MGSQVGTHVNGVFEYISASRRRPLEHLSLCHKTPADISTTVMVHTLDEVESGISLRKGIEDLEEMIRDTQRQVETARSNALLSTGATAASQEETADMFARLILTTGEELQQAESDWNRLRPEVKASVEAEMVCVPFARLVTRERERRC